MSFTPRTERNRVQLRLWPGVVAVLLLWFIRFGVPAVLPDAIPVAILSEFVCALAVLVWWLFFSRVPRPERWGAILLLIAASFATRRILHESIATGMMGMMFLLYSIPFLCLALVVWAVVSGRLPGRFRRPALAATIRSEEHTSELQSL